MHDFQELLKLFNAIAWNYRIVEIDVIIFVTLLSLITISSIS